MKKNQKIWDALNSAKRGFWEPSIVLVMPEPCKNCLLGPDRLVPDEHRDDILEQLNINGCIFECHISTIAGQPRCCHKFFEQNLSLVVRLAKMNGWWEYRGIHERSSI